MGTAGQRKRVALVSTLMADTDLLILDEPTNHLDSDMADWLEDHLKKFRGAILMITHDRYFLDSVANRIENLIRASFTAIRPIMRVIWRCVLSAWTWLRHRSGNASLFYGWS